MLTDAQIRTHYRNCLNGYYSGPQPGKARYTKDRFVWAVTPAFAAKFCMPQDFISTELKGAEAVAYRMVVDDSEETCGWNGRIDVCNLPRWHRFEIYYPTGSIPKVREASYYTPAMLASKMLITPTDKEQAAKHKSVKEKPRLGAMGVFESFAFVTTKSAAVDLVLGGAYVHQYYEEVFEKIDFVAVEASPGFTKEMRWGDRDSASFALGVKKPGTRHRHETLDEYHLVISLPKRITEALVRNDRMPGTDLLDLARPDKAQQP